MHTTFRRALPRRLVTLSLLPPPSCGAPLAPFGFAGFVMERACLGEARFTLHALGFASGYDPARMRGDIRALFDPETTALICGPWRSVTAEHSTAPLPSSYRELIPRIGLRHDILAPVPRHLLATAGRVGGLDLPETEPSPLARLGQIGKEAQAAWIFWLQAYCPVNLRRKLLAGYLAWQYLEHARLQLARS